MNSKNEQANGLPYNFIYNMKLKERKKKYMNSKNEQANGLPYNFIYNMKLKEGKKKK